MNRWLLPSLLLLLAAPALLQAQNAITFEEFASRVDRFFAPELVQDVRDALPQGTIDVWGFDAGDFSADGANDLAIAFRLRGDARKRVNVWLFVDEEGILRPIKQISTEFLELPIEVGVGITNGEAITTRKIAPDHWEVHGYAYRSGVVMLVSRFTTERLETLTHESYRNFQTLEGYERYVSALDTQVVFRSDFLTVPSYTRGRDVSTGYRATALATQSRYIQQGSYYWNGPRDMTLGVRSAYDNEYLYFNVVVTDDEVIPAPQGENDSAADRLELWLDMYSLGDRFRVGRRARDFRTKTDSNIYAFTITLGDLVDEPAQVKIASSNILDETQSNAAKLIRGVTLRTDTGYALKMRIPFAFFGFAAPPLDERGITPFGATVVVHDLDNPYRPMESTVVTTSQNFDRTKPATFGALALVPTETYYGESYNVFLGEVRERLDEVGF